MLLSKCVIKHKNHLNQKEAQSIDCVRYIFVEFIVYSNGLAFNNELSHVAGARYDGLLNIFWLC